MYALALRFSGNHHDAEDLVQEVFLSAYRAIHRFRGDSSFRTWLHRILVNSFVSQKRKKVLPVAGEVTERSAFAVTGTDRTAFNNIMVDQIMRRIEGLSPQQRLMFVMKHRLGLTCDEVAEYFGTTEGTVKKTLFRVMSKLREEFLGPEPGLTKESNARLPEIP